MSNCNECLYSNDGMCQNDKCLFDLEDNCYEFASRTTYDAIYNKGREDAIDACIAKVDTLEQISFGIVDTELVKIMIMELKEKKQ